MKHYLSSALLGTALLVTAATAEAATRTVFISGSDLAGTGASSLGVALPDGSTNSVTINLTLPKGFKKNSTAKLTLRMTGGGASCVLDMIASGTIRVRSGSVSAITPGATSGLTIVPPGAVVTPAVPGQAFSKTFILAPPIGTTVVGQRTGDSVVAVIARAGGSVTDTCASVLTVTSVRFTYQIP